MNGRFLSRLAYLEVDRFDVNRFDVNRFVLRSGLPRRIGAER